MEKGVYFWMVGLTQTTNVVKGTNEILREETKIKGTQTLLFI